MNNVRFEWISLNRVNRVKYGLTEYVENLILDGELLGIHVEYCKTKFNFFNIYYLLQIYLNLIWEVQKGNSSLLFSPIDEIKIIK